MSNTQSNLRPNAAEIRRWIFQGHYDSDIDSILTTVRDRREACKLQEVSHLRSGDMARCGNTISPKYLRGLEVTIVSVFGDKALVTFTDSLAARRFGYGRVNVHLRSLIPSH